MSNERFSKSDMERVGIFKELGYLRSHPSGTNNQVSFNESAGRGRQMMGGTSHARSGLQDGYFEHNFRRILAGESYHDRLRARHEWQKQQDRKRISKNPFRPAGESKKPSGLGSHYGTLGGAVEHFRPSTTRAKRTTTATAERRNFVTNPAKKGTGWGYSDVTIGPYPPHRADPYEGVGSKGSKGSKGIISGKAFGVFRTCAAPGSFFDENPFAAMPAPLRRTRTAASGTSGAGRPVSGAPFLPSSPGKRPVGAHDGCFGRYAAVSGLARSRRPATSGRRPNDVFVPNPGPKSAPVASVLHLNVLRSINSQNYKSLASVMSY